MTTFINQRMFVFGGRLCNNTGLAELQSYIPSCINDTECSTNNTCILGTCKSGMCTYTNANDGTLCEQDGQFCNGQEVLTKFNETFFSEVLFLYNLYFSLRK